MSHPTVPMSFSRSPSPLIAITRTRKEAVGGSSPSPEQVTERLYGQSTAAQELRKERKEEIEKMRAGHNIRTFQNRSSPSVRVREPSPIPKSRNSIPNTPIPSQ